MLSYLQHRVYSVCFSADGKFIASGSRDNTVKIWDGATGQLLQTPEGHSNTVNSVALSADGSRVASGSWDKTVKIWKEQAEADPESHPIDMESWTKECRRRR